VTRNGHWCFVRTRKRSQGFCHCMLLGTSAASGRKLYNRTAYTLQACCLSGCLGKECSAEKLPFAVRPGVVFSSKFGGAWRPSG